MLRVSTLYACTAEASARYYTRYLEGSGPGDDEGVWLGRQADALGLSGTVDTEQLEALLSGHDPVSGERLGSALVDRYRKDGSVQKAVAGFDASFSAPKSLSAWWALTGDTALLDAHDTAVQAALDYLESHGATTRVRVNGARTFPDAQGLTMAAFRQCTSREDDPQLHTHVVISTKVRAPSGRWYALDARFLKGKQRALGGLYQSVLRAELSHRYGVAWKTIVNGQAEIAGFPKELMTLFSKRAAQVDELTELMVQAFQETEGRDPTRRERARLERIAATESRQKKTGQAVADLAPRWRSDAAEIGWTPDRLEHALTRPVASRVEPPPAPTIGDVLDQLSADGSTWLPVDVLRAVCDISPPTGDKNGRNWFAALAAAVDQVTRDHIDLDPVATGPVRESDGRSVWLEPVKANLTHELILEQEERILSFAMEAQDDEPAPSTTVNVADLDILQADAARAVAGEDRLVIVVGPAGAGKTTTLATAVDDLRSHHRPVFGIAPTGKGARVLDAEANLPSVTVAKLLYEWNRPEGPEPGLRLPMGTTLVVDESGMIGTGSLDQLVGLAHSQDWRLVLVGDPRQLQAVGRGGMFDELCRSARTHELATIHRFRHAWEQTASLRLRSGRPDVIETYLANDRVTAGTIDDHLERIADAWMTDHKAGLRVAVTAETNEHVDALNAAIQRRRRRRAQVDMFDTVPVAGSESVGAGDHVVTRHGDRRLRTEHDEPVRNRDIWTVDAVRPDGSMNVSHLDRHGTVELPADYTRMHVRLGYAATEYGTQGDTVDVGYTLVSRATSHQGLYVGATRGRDANHLAVITDGPDLGQARDVVEWALVNDRADIPATAQRRALSESVPTKKPDLIRQAADAAFILTRTKREAAPAIDALKRAEDSRDAAQRDVASVERRLAECRPWHRRGVGGELVEAQARLEAAQARHAEALEDARPWFGRIAQAQGLADEADRVVPAERVRGSLDELPRRPVQRETLSR